MARRSPDLDDLVRRLERVHARNARRAPRPDPGALAPPLDRAPTPYESARAGLAQREQRLAALGELGDRLVAELLPPVESRADTEDGADVAVLRALQRGIFRHPLAFRAAFAALAAEGRRYAATEAGAADRAALEESPLLARVRLFGKMLSFSMLEEGEPEHLPTTYLEGLFRLAGDPDADAVLDRLFGGSEADDAAAR